MTVKSVYQIAFDEKCNARPNSNVVFQKVLKYLPKDQLPNVTILLQDSGYVTIRPMRLRRSDWGKLNRSIKRIGGLWVSNNNFSHWSIPLTRTN